MFVISAPPFNDGPVLKQRLDPLAFAWNAPPPSRVRDSTAAALPLIPVAARASSLLPVPARPAFSNSSRSLSMPRIGGIEAAPRLKTLLPQTPIILFTLHGGLIKGCDTREIGVDAVVAKQDGISALGASVHSLFAKTR